MEQTIGWIVEFSQNLCLFAATILSYRETIAAVRTDRQRGLALGVVFGIAAAIGAMMPLSLPFGYYVDAELIPIGISGIFGGPVAIGIATAIAAIFQLCQPDPDSALDMIEPILGGVAAIGFFLFERHRKAPVGLVGLVVLGTLVAAMIVLDSVLLDDRPMSALVATALVYVLPSSVLGTVIFTTVLRREDATLKRKRAHAQESKMLDAVVHSMSDGLLAVDSNGKFLVFNQPAQEMLGDWRDEKYDSWLKDYQRFHLDGKTPVASDELALTRALRGLETKDLNVVVRSPSRPDGFVVSVNGRPLRDDRGNVIAGITVVRDVSELLGAQQRLAESEAALKRSEERYALAFEGAYDGLWDWDLHTNKVFLSARCLEIVGYPRTKDVAGRTEDYGWWTSLIHADDAGPALKAIQDALQGGMQSFAVEYRVRRVDGSYCWISDRGAVIRDVLGNPQRAAGSFTDISTRKLAEEHRRMLEDQLQQAQKIEAVGTLAGGIAHDINNTLIPIIGTVDMLIEDTPKDSELGESLQDVMSAAVKIKELVRQILAFSRQKGAERRAVNMGGEVASALRMLRTMIQATVALDLYARGDEFTCEVNTTQLHQVIMNLVSNAVGAIGSNRGAIRVTLERIDIEDGAAIPGQAVAAGAFCRISVVDTGPGIPAELKARLFDPFFTTKSVGQGTGLGLSVVQGIVRGHGGFVLVSNEPGEGARFDVHFPLVEQEAAAKAS